MKTMPVSLNDFYTRAIANSSQIKVFSDLPLIRQTAIQEAEGAFDAEVFADGRNDWRDDPVGSTLTTGGADRLVEDDFRLRTGIRKKVAQTGATVYATQEFTYRDSNSQFFVPNDQTGARITVGFNQPLLRGAGKGFNHAVINIAKIDSEIAQKEFIRQTESHLLEITRTYWTLYMARGAYKAKARAFGDANGTLEDLESRENFDALKQQIFRARAATAERKAALVRAESAVRNAEDRLKALVNDPEMNQATALEMIPSDAPITTRTPGDLAAAAAIALENRAEIQQAYLQLKSAGLRRDMSRNELLPVLNFIAETYQAGLSEDDWGAAWDDQWQASPGYAVGLRFDYPLGNNQAEARNIRRRLEMRQLVNQIRTTMDTILLEVKVTVREVQTAYRDLIAKSQSMQAARDDLSNLTERREAMFLGANTSAPAYLEFLLESQDRRTAAEEAFLGALATYNVALVSLERAKGTLLTYEDLEVKRIEEEDPEHIWLEKEDKMLPKLVIEKIAAAQ
jgi:outer membrane protein TolC